VHSQYDARVSELLIAAAVIALVWVVAIGFAVHAARRRSRARAERILDVLATEACEALAWDDRSRRSDRAIARYDRVHRRVATARTCRELEAAIARDRLRLAARDLAGRGVERVREFLPRAVRIRRF
jgi:hypothetical protein